MSLIAWCFSRNVEAAEYVGDSGGTLYEPRLQWWFSRSFVHAYLYLSFAAEEMHSSSNLPFQSGINDDDVAEAYTRWGICPKLLEMYPLWCKLSSYYQVLCTQCKGSEEARNVSAKADVPYGKMIGCLAGNSSCVCKATLSAVLYDRWAKILPGEFHMLACIGYYLELSTAGETEKRNIVYVAKRQRRRGGC